MNNLISLSLRISKISRSEAPESKSSTLHLTITEVLFVGVTLFKSSLRAFDLMKGDRAIVSPSSSARADARDSSIGGHITLAGYYYFLSFVDY